MGFLDGIKGIFNSSSGRQSVQTPAPVAQKVLVVEDEDMLATALVMKLKHDGFNVERAANGQIGLELIQAFVPDIILVDIMMPVMDGKAMLKKLREIPQFKTLPVIVLTNAGTVENMEEVRLATNVNDFLIKSNVNLDEVAAKIRSLLPKQTTSQPA